MKAELKAKWVAALRSGEYQQGKYRLMSPDGFCCWGVLRHIADPEDTRSEADGRCVTNDQLVEWGFGHFYQSRHLLENMNDRDTSFAEIADYIEVNIPSDGEATPQEDAK